MFKSSTARTDAASSRGVLLPPDLQLTAAHIPPPAGPLGGEAQREGREGRQALSLSAFRLHVTVSHLIP